MSTVPGIRSAVSGEESVDLLNSYNRRTPTEIRRSGSSRYANAPQYYVRRTVPYSRGRS